MARPEQVDRRTVVVALPQTTDGWFGSPPYIYHIAGYEFDGEFHLGFQAVDPSPAHPDVIPDRVYQTLLANIRPELDLPSLRACVSEDTAQTVGRCTIIEAEDVALEASIELVDDFRPTHT
jgi:hypothetical protein